MIISVNSKPSIHEFKKLMMETDIFLNNDALTRHDYYVKRSGSLLEHDVKVALEECAKNTPFENTIEMISGQKFPDIVAAKFYGVEVKSTKGNHWTSTGSSIMESTRITDVERIYMTFGKLGGNPIEFLSRPYEECLYGIAVTHMPRYLINMELSKGETIFDKINIPYDELRKMDNPIAPVSRYYRSLLKPGESLWWAGDSVEDEVVSATVKLWKNLTMKEKRRYTTYGCAYFPEVFGGNYDRYALWLTSQGVVDSHIRDQFSAGGQELMIMPDGTMMKFPGVYRRIKINKEYFMHLLSIKYDIAVEELLPVRNKILGKKILDWCEVASRSANVNFNDSVNALSMFFFESDYESALANYSD